MGEDLFLDQGAYILSPLEESSRDKEQNSGFVVSWVCANQESRVTSYSVRNLMDSSVTRWQRPASGTRSRSSTVPSLSKVLNSASFITATSGQVNYGAFKILPIDPARVRRESSGMSEMYMGLCDEMKDAVTCREVGDLIVDRIWRACEEVGGGQGDNFVVEEDVVRWVNTTERCEM